MVFDIDPPKKKKFFKLPKFVRNFFPYRMKRQVKELFIASVIVNLALSMVMIFEPIYLFNIGYSLFHIALFYLMVYGVYFFTIPLGAKFANHFGYENSIFVGSIFYVLFYISLFLIPSFPVLFYVSALLYILQKTFYWPGFHGNFAHNCGDSEEGKEITSINVSNSLMFVLGPIMGGLIITFFGFAVLFLVASILFLVSNIPMLLTKEVFEKRKYNYVRLFDNFKKENIKSFIACIGYGEELIVMVIWPIFMSIIIVNYAKLGALSGIGTGITLLMALYIGKICDQQDRRKILKFGSIIYAFTWFLRVFTKSLIPIFLIDTTSKMSKTLIDTPIRAILYTKAKYGKQNNDNSIMENVINWEAGLIFGKFLACLVIMVLISVFSLQDASGFVISFIFAGALSFLYMLYK
jgi:MFS family permease